MFKFAEFRLQRGVQFHARGRYFVSDGNTTISAEEEKYFGTLLGLDAVTSK
ncbi:hypothetical protein ACLWBD_00465 [Bdellovibrio sp. HCB117]|uniref:hypothetical protein n=1 Tax=Bdellovibrio sp. HCB117 TaxID=3394359 RepID=UPI0039B46698